MADEKRVEVTVYPGGWVTAREMGRALRAALERAPRDGGPSRGPSVAEQLRNADMRMRFQHVRPNPGPFELTPHEPTAADAHIEKAVAEEMTARTEERDAAARALFREAVEAGIDPGATWRRRSTRTDVFTISSLRARPALRSTPGGACVLEVGWLRGGLACGVSIRSVADFTMRYEMVAPAKHPTHIEELGALGCYEALVAESHAEILRAVLGPCPEPAPGSFVSVQAHPRMQDAAAQAWRDVGSAAAVVGRGLCESVAVERHASSSCARCGGPVLLTSCAREGGCRTAEERVRAAGPPRIRCVCYEAPEGRYYIDEGGVRTAEHPSPSMALADWLEQRLAQERSR